MKTVEIEGTVPESFSNQSYFYMKVAEKDKLKAKNFFDTIDTVYRNESIQIGSKKIVSNCKAGDQIQVTFEVVSKKSGTGIKAIDFIKINKA